MTAPSLTPSPARGVALVLAAAMLWGTTGTAQSFAPTGLPSVWVGAFRLLLSALFFAAVFAVTRARRGAEPANLHGPGVIGAALCMTVYNLAFFAGVRALGVAVGTAIAIGSAPVWAGALQAALGGGMPRPAWWLGTGLAIGGGTLMAIGPGTGATFDPVGIALCLLTGLSYAVYATLNQRLIVHAAPGAVTGAVFAWAALLALPPAWLLGGPIELGAIGAPAWAVFVWLGVAATGVAYLCFSHALRHIPAATGVTLALAEPLTAFMLAVVVVGERPGLAAGLGLAALVAGLAVVIRAETRAARR